MLKTCFAFPVYTLETKGFQSTYFSKIQNQHNSAHMLRSLTLWSNANEPDWESLYNPVTILVSVLRNNIAIHAHWAVINHGVIKAFGHVEQFAWIGAGFPLGSVCIILLLGTLFQRLQHEIDIYCHGGTL